MVKADKRRFRELCRLEPGLKLLYDKARAVKDRGGRYFCANEIWIREFKPLLINLVGWHARNHSLRTTEAYDVAYHTIYDALPDCRDCLCPHR